MCVVTALGKLVPQKIQFDLFVGYSCTVLPAKKGKNPLPNQLNQCNELIKGEKNPFFVFLSLPALHYWPACICLCEPIKSVLLIATNCLTQLACVLIQKKRKTLLQQYSTGLCSVQDRAEQKDSSPFSPLHVFTQKVTKVSFNDSYQHSSCSFSHKKMLEKSA